MYLEELGTRKRGSLAKGSECGICGARGVFKRNIKSRKGHIQVTLYCNRIGRIVDILPVEFGGHGDLRGSHEPTDKLERLQLTSAEIQAMVECADNAGVFVTAHAYTVKAIRHYIDNGVREIEHGNFVDPPTAKLMAERVSI